MTKDLRVSDGQADAANTLPDGWVPLLIEYEPGYPEEVAFGPQRMMDRLKIWLDKHFARIAEDRLRPSHSGIADALRQYRHNDGSEGFVFGYDKEMTDRYVAGLLSAAPASAERVEQEPFAWATFDGEGSYDLRMYECNEEYQSQFLASHKSATYKDWVFPLYTAPQPTASRSKAMSDKLERLTAWQADCEWGEALVVQASSYDALEAASAADKARIDELESALGTLTKAAKELRAATPLLHCELFHHKRLDQHSSEAECPPFERWCVAALSVTEALAQQEKSNV
jgi:hypothetical protein